jgi:NADP-reducing hydrogenase subunit HndD
MKDIPSTARSPQQMFGSIAKTYFADKINVDRKKMVVVSIMPCVAKKYECTRDEFKVDGNPDVDYSVSTRELGQLIKRANIDFANLQDEEFDKPLGESTGAAVIFGTTGGVIEAAVRTAYELHTGKTLKRLTLNSSVAYGRHSFGKSGFQRIRTQYWYCSWFGQCPQVARRDQRRQKPVPCHRNHGLPRRLHRRRRTTLHHGDSSILKARQKAIYTEDAGKKLRKSHENPDIIKLYEEFLGKPLGDKAHHLLHTHYFVKDNDVQKIHEICKSFNNEPGELINVLHKTQEFFGYLPAEVQEEVAEGLNVSVAKVYGVVTFYSFFTMLPKGRFPISICTGTACYVRGAEKVLDEFKRILKVPVGETTPDGKFSITCLRCVGACGLAPVVMVGEKTYGRVTTDGVKDILKEYENE